MHGKDLAELTTHCIRCGFCLEDCPTFKITGEETESPRGRIYLIRSAEEGKLNWRTDVAPHMDQCLGCRACETACPSGVEYGSIFELAKERIEATRSSTAKRLLLRGLTNPQLAKIQFQLASLLPNRRLPSPINRLVSNAPAEADIPKPQSAVSYPPLDETTLPAIRGEVAVLRGCVMGVLYNPVHQATERLLRRIGYRTRWIETPCCGALHAHGGFLKEATKMANRLVSETPPTVPVLTNSAGCGSTMKEYGHLDPLLKPFGERVQDVTEFLLQNGLTERLKESAGLSITATYHDACHLAHGQRVTQPPRQLLQAIPNLTYRALTEADTCCGSAGIYNIQQPEMARKLLDRKWHYIEETGASVVVTGNPGCFAWIQQAAEEHGKSVRVVHTLELLEASLNPKILNK